MERKNKIIKYSISVLLISMLFINMLKNTSVKDMEIFGICILEIINIILISIPFVLSVLKKTKERKYLLIYLITFTIYLIFHLVNIRFFNGNLLINADINIFKESYYIIRTYLLPIMLLYVLISNNKIFDKKYYLKTSSIIIAIMSFSIIILNIFKLSFISYSVNNDFVKFNVFDYFTYQGDFKLITSRGWFNSANEISAVLFSLLPINVYLLYSEKKLYNIILLTGQIVAMIMIGTRVSSIGCIIMMIISIMIYLIISKFKKSKIDFCFFKKAFLITCLSAVFFSFSPMVRHLYEKNAIDTNKENAYDELRNADENNIKEIILKNHYYYRIDEYFIDIYPIENDPIFWLDVAKRDNSLNTNNRKFKTDMIRRVSKLNNNKMDSLLGMGYTTYFPDLEKDYVYQYYLFGIFGIAVFFGPYLLIIIKKSIMVLKNMNYLNIISFISVCSILGCAYLSGHVLGWIVPTFIVVMLLGLLPLVKED